MIGCLAMSTTQSRRPNRPDRRSGAKPDRAEPPSRSLPGVKRSVMYRLIRSVLPGALLAICLTASAWARSDQPDQEAMSANAAAQAKADSQALQVKVDALRAQLKPIQDGAQRYRLLGELVQTYAKAGRIGDSLRVRDELVEDRQIEPGRRSLTASALALSVALIGDFPRAQRLVNRARQLASEAKPEELDTLPIEPAYASLDAEAEIARRSLNRHDIALQKTREKSELSWLNLNDASLSPKRRKAAASELLNNLFLHVLVLVQNNRRDEALSYVRELQQRMAQHAELRGNAYQDARVQAALAVALCSHDDYDAALAAVTASINQFIALQTDARDTALGIARRLRLMIALAVGRLPEFTADVALIDQARATNPVFAGSYPGGETYSLGRAAQGKWDEAIVIIDELIARTLRNQGQDSPFFKYQSAMQLLYRFAGPKEAVSQSTIERFVAARASNEDAWIDASLRGSYVEDAALTGAVQYLLHRAEPDAAGTALAFRTAELLLANSSQGALADGAARLAAATPTLRRLIEREQTLRFDEHVSRRAFAAASDRSERLSQQPGADAAVARRQAADAQEKGKALQAGESKVRELRRQIGKEFPIYRELISYNIPNAQQIAAVLQPGEVYLNLYAGYRAGHAFAVQANGQLTGRAVAVSQQDTRAWIGRLRAPFDAGRPPTRAGTLGGFDLIAAHQLYQTWIAPMRSELAGAHTVYIAASGVLGSVPWATLVSQPAATLKDAKWWSATVTPVKMPSASSLVLARSLPRRTAGQPLLAFADPSFDLVTPRTPPDTTRHAVRARAIGADAAGLAFDYHRLSPLPETLDEVRAIATALGAPDQALVHGAQASRSRVLQQDLSDYRVITFATHGLLPGEAPGVLKAGLAMAYEGRGLADSLLTIDDIVGLRLNADWVVLSACNTGYASGQAGDTMSALSRGFFAAGARTVLATHWAVESESAKQLVVATFKAFEQQPTLSKGQALAAAQREMMRGQYGALYQHPYFWAPYFVTGDARR